MNDSGLNRKIASISVASCLLLVAALVVAAFRRETIEYPVMHFLNLPSQIWPLLDHEVVVLTSNHLASGVVFLSLVWHAWFCSTHSGYRARILMGTAGAAVSGILSRILQLALPLHPRPLHDPGLTFLPPVGADPKWLNHWNSFPSDHAAVYFALATVIYLATPKLGYWAYAWAAVLGISRNYLGLHYPSDVVAGGAIGALTVSLLQGRRFGKLGRGLVSFEQSATPVFYMIAFFLSYQVATLFDELRSFASDSKSVIEALRQHLFP
jgi:membrane-associated phospholipid phosphatase